MASDEDKIRQVFGVIAHVTGMTVPAVVEAWQAMMVLEFTPHQCIDVFRAIARHRGSDLVLHDNLFAETGQAAILVPTCPEGAS